MVNAQYASLPPQTAQYTLCSPGQRAAEFLIDLIAFFVIEGVFNVLLPGLGGVIGLGLGVYLSWLEGETGMDLGKKAIGLYVVDAGTGDVIGGVRAIGRDFLHILDFLPFGAGYIVGLVTGRTFADRIMNTVVVSSVPPRPSEVRAPAWWLPKEWQNAASAG